MVAKVLGLACFGCRVSLVLVLVLLLLPQCTALPNVTVLSYSSMCSTLLLWVFVIVTGGAIERSPDASSRHFLRPGTELGYGALVHLYIHGPGVVGDAVAAALFVVEQRCA